MKRYNNLYEKVYEFENLLNALKKSMRSNKSQESFEYWNNMEYKLIELQKKLKNLSYMPKPYRYFTIYEPKERDISVANFEDRIVHHAIVSILEPIYEKVFIYDSYATRKEKGTHKAVYKAQEYLRENYFYFKTDIKKYFDNINHKIIMDILTRKIKDKGLINIIERIIKNSSETGVGLPIGNLTSQFFANVYLDRLDHYVKDNLGVKYYIRYMDDFVIFSDDIEYLKEMKIKVQLFLKEKLLLELKESATYINTRQNGLSFLGTRIFKNLIRIKKENLTRSIKKIKKREYEYYNGIITETKLQESVNSIIAHMKNYNINKFLKGIYL